MSLKKSPEEIEKLQLEMDQRIKKISNQDLDLNPEEVKFVIAKEG